MTHRSQFSALLLTGLLCLSGCAGNDAAAKGKFFESGNEYFTQKKYGEAVVQYGNALKLDPKYGAAQLALAKSYAASSNNRAAFPAYIRAADLLPDDLELQVFVGRLLVNGGFFEEAKTRARTVLQKQPNNVAALLVLGNALAGLKNLDDAVNVLSRAVEVDPERAGIYTNLGILQFAGGDRDAAEATFKRAVSVAPTLPDAYINLGNFYRALRRLPDAEQALKNAYALDPKNPRSNDALASLYVEWNRPAEAEPYLKAVVAITGTGAAQFALADFYMATGRFPDAFRTLDEASTIDGQYTAAKTRAALLEYSTGDRLKAHQIIDEVLERNRNNAEALIVRARLLLADQRPERALEQITLAIAADPRSISAQITLGRAQMALNKVEEARKAFNDAVRLDPNAFSALLELAELHRTRNELDTSLEFAERALKVQPESIPARLTLIRTLLVREQDQKRAETEVQALIAKHPNSPQAQSTLGALSLAKNNEPSARRSFERALELDPRSLEALTGLTALDIARKNGVAARVRIEGALSKQPNSPGLLVLAAKVYALNGDATKMEAALTHALKFDSANPEIYGLLGQMYANERKLPEAQKQFAEIARLNPDSVPATMMLGLLCYVQKDLTCAKTWWQKTLTIDPRAAVAANNLASLYADTGENLESALQLAYVAKARYPDLPDVNDTLGWVFYKRDLPQQAIPYLEQTVKADGKNPLYQFHLGMAYTKRGDDAKARRTLERALELDKNPEWADEARKTLKTLVF